MVLRVASLPLHPRIQDPAAPSPWDDPCNPGASCPSPRSARRRLVFMEDVFKGQTFYLDLKGRGEQLEEDLVALGARVERFLSRDITCVVTSSRQGPGQGKTGVPSPASPASDFSCPAGSRPRPTAPLSRGQALLNRSNKACSSNKDASDVLSFARRWDIRIKHVKDIVKAVQRERAKFEDNDRTLESSADFKDSRKRKPVRVRKLGAPFLKVEDSFGLYRPLYQRFDSFPAVDVNSEHCDSPFAVRPNNKPKPVPVKPERHSETPKQKQPQKKDCNVLTNAQKSKKTEPRKRPGFCECCDVYYKDLDEHTESATHREFAVQDENFLLLDDTIRNLPTVSDLLLGLAKVVHLTPESVRQEENNNHIKNEDVQEQLEEVGVAPGLQTCESPDGRLSGNALGLFTPKEKVTMAQVDETLGQYYGKGAFDSCDPADDSTSIHAVEPSVETPLDSPLQSTLTPGQSNHVSICGPKQTEELELNVITESQDIVAKSLLKELDSEKSPSCEKGHVVESLTAVSPKRCSQPSDQCVPPGKNNLEASCEGISLEQSCDQEINANLAVTEELADAGKLHESAILQSKSAGFIRSTETPITEPSVKSKPLDAEHDSCHDSHKDQFFSTAAQFKIDHADDTSSKHATTTFQPWKHSHRTSHSEQTSIHEKLDSIVASVCGSVSCSSDAASREAFSCYSAQESRTNASLPNLGTSALSFNTSVAQDNDQVGFLGVLQTVSACKSNLAAWTADTVDYESCQSATRNLPSASSHSSNHESEIKDVAMDTKIEPMTLSPPPPVLFPAVIFNQQTSTSDQPKEDSVHLLSPEPPLLSPELDHTAWCTSRVARKDDLEGTLLASPDPPILTRQVSSQAASPSKPVFSEVSFDMAEPPAIFSGSLGAAIAEGMTLFSGSLDGIMAEETADSALSVAHKAASVEDPAIFSGLLDGIMAEETADSTLSVTHKAASVEDPALFSGSLGPGMVEGNLFSGSMGATGVAFQGNTPFSSDLGSGSDGFASVKKNPSFLAVSNWLDDGGSEVSDTLDVTLVPQEAEIVYSTPCASNDMGTESKSASIPWVGADKHCPDKLAVTSETDCPAALSSHHSSHSLSERSTTVCQQEVPAELPVPIAASKCGETTGVNFATSEDDVDVVGICSPPALLSMTGTFMREQIDLLNPISGQPIVELRQSDEEKLSKQLNHRDHGSNLTENPNGPCTPVNTNNTDYAAHWPGQAMAGGNYPTFNGHSIPSHNHLQMPFGVGMVTPASVTASGWMDRSENAMEPCWREETAHSGHWPAHPQPAAFTDFNASLSAFHPVNIAAPMPMEAMHVSMYQGQIYQPSQNVNMVYQQQIPVEPQQCALDKTLIPHEDSCSRSSAGFCSDTSQSLPSNHWQHSDSFASGWDSSNSQFNFGLTTCNYMDVVGFDASSLAHSQQSRVQQKTSKVKTQRRRSTKTKPKAKNTPHTEILPQTDNPPSIKVRLNLSSIRQFGQTLENDPTIHSGSSTPTTPVNRGRKRQSKSSRSTPQSAYEPLGDRTTQSVIQSFPSDCSAPSTPVARGHRGQSKASLATPKSTSGSVEHQTPQTRTPIVPSDNSVPAHGGRQHRGTPQTIPVTPRFSQFPLEVPPPHSLTPVPEDVEVTPQLRDLDETPTAGGQWRVAPAGGLKLKLVRTPLGNAETGGSPGWSVQRSGSCRLTFSAKKDTTSSQIKKRANKENATPQKSKRRRILF